MMKTMLGRARVGEGSVKRTTVMAEIKIGRRFRRKLEMAECVLCFDSIVTFTLLAP